MTKFYSFEAFSFPLQAIINKKDCQKQKRNTREQPVMHRLKYIEGRKNKKEKYTHGTGRL